MNEIVWLKFICLSFAIAYGITVIGNVIGGNEVCATKVILFSVFLSAFITLQWLLQ